MPKISLQYYKCIVKNLVAEAVRAIKKKSQKIFFCSLWCLGNLVECSLVLYGTSEHPYKRHEQPRSAKMSNDDDTEEYNSVFCSLFNLHINER